MAVVVVGQGGCGDGCECGGEGTLEKIKQRKLCNRFFFYKLKVITI